MKDFREHPEAIPPAALVLSAAGSLPFLWGAATVAVPALERAGGQWLGPRFVGQYVMISFGTVVLCFLSGVLWGFANRARGGTATVGFGLAALPALWAFLFVGGGADAASLWLVAGLLGLLGLDWLFWHYALAPVWWMRLRHPLTLLAAGCLIFGVLA